MSRETGRHEKNATGSLRKMGCQLDRNNQEGFMGDVVFDGILKTDIFEGDCSGQGRVKGIDKFKR